MWSKVKQFLRGAEARTEEVLTKAVANALTEITKSDAIGWFQSYGYTLF